MSRLKKTQNIMKIDLNKMLQSYAKRRDGEWVTNSGADVTKVV